MDNIHISLNEFRNASRVIKETSSLLRRGIFEKITIIALGANDLPEHELIDENIHVLRIRLKTRNLSKHPLVQLIKYLEFSIKCINSIRKLKPRVVNIHGLALLVLASYSKYINKHLLVYDAHELETEVNGLKGLRKSIAKWIERGFIRYCDLILVVSESIADWYAHEYKIPRPLVILNVPKRIELRLNNNFREKLNIRADQIILLYQGGLAAGRGVHLILDAFKARISDRVAVVFMGYGELEQDIVKASKDHSNIFFFPAVPPSEVLEYTASADIGISLIENTCLSYYYCMPNKLFEYAMAGLPVLVSNMKDMSEFVTKNQMGAVIHDFSATGINQAIDDFLKMDLTAMKQNAYRAACENAWEVQEKNMIEAYQNLLLNADDNRIVKKHIENESVVGER